MNKKWEFFRPFEGKIAGAANKHKHTFGSSEYSTFAKKQLVDDIFVCGFSLFNLANNTGFVQFPPCLQLNRFTRNLLFGRFKWILFFFAKLSWPKPSCADRQKLISHTNDSQSRKFATCDCLWWAHTFKWVNKCERTIEETTMNIDFSDAHVHTQLATDD